MRPQYSPRRARRAKLQSYQSDWRVPRCAPEGSALSASASASAIFSSDTSELRERRVPDNRSRVQPSMHSEGLPSSCSGRAGAKRWLPGDDTHLCWLLAAGHAGFPNLPHFEGGLEAPTSIAMSRSSCAQIRGQQPKCGPPALDNYDWDSTRRYAQFSLVNKVYECRASVA